MRYRVGRTAIYGVVLGATYELLGVLVPVKAAVILTKAEQAEIIAGGPNPNTMDSADINDHLPSSSPSGKTVLIIFGVGAGQSADCPRRWRATRLPAPACHR